MYITLKTSGWRKENPSWPKVRAACILGGILEGPGPVMSFNGTLIGRSRPEGGATSILVL